MRSWVSIIRSSTGFSITEVMVGGAILAGVAVAGARMFKDQRSAQSKVDSDQVLQQFHMNLTKFLQDEKNCNATLSSWGWNGRQATTMASVGFGDIYSCSNCGSTPGFNYDMSNSSVGTKYIGPGDWIESATGNATNARRLWMLKSMRWKSGATPPSGTGTFMMQVEYEMNPATAGSMASKKMTVIKDIALNLRFNQDPLSANRLLKECISPKEAAMNNLQVDVCKSMNMNGGGANNVMGWRDGDQNCEVKGKSASGQPPVQTCPNANMVVEGIRSDGSVNCVNLTDGVNANTLMNNAACAPGATIRMEYNTVTKQLETRCY